MEETKHPYKPKILKQKLSVSSKKGDVKDADKFYERMRKAKQEKERVGKILESGT